MAETPLKNLRMLKELCRGNAFKKVIIVTTMWDKVDEKTGVPREEKMKTYHASIERFEGTRDSAFRMIVPLLREPSSSRIALSIQKELVDHGLILGETDAGQVLRRELERSTEQHQERLYQIRKDLKIELGATSDSLQSLKEEHEKLKKSCNSFLQQMHDLQVPLGRRVANTVARTLGKKRNY